MGEAIGAIVGNGVGVAISPIPIVAVIVALFSPSGARTAVGMLIGWVVGLAVACGVFAALGPVAGDDPGLVVGVLKVVIGGLFWYLAWRQWRSQRHRHGDDVGDGGDRDEAALPGWLAAVDSFTLARSIGIGFALAAVNPKNLGLAAAAGGSIAVADTAAAATAVLIVIFVVLGSLTVGLPVLARVAAPDRSAPILAALRGWLVCNNATVMMVLFLVLGARLLGDGLAALIG